MALEALDEEGECRRVGVLGRIEELGVRRLPSERPKNRDKTCDRGSSESGKDQVCNVRRHLAGSSSMPLELLVKWPAGFSQRAFPKGAHVRPLVYTDRDAT